METLQTLLFVLQVLVALALIGFILIQHGKGADAGAAFGSGASSTVFGSSGSGNFMTRATTILALVFLVNSLGLSYIATQRARQETSLINDDTPTLPMQLPTAPTENTVVPAVPVDDAAADTGSDIPEVPQE